MKNKKSHSFDQKVEDWINAHRPTFFHPAKSWLKYLSLKLGSAALRGTSEIASATARTGYYALTPDKMPSLHEEETLALFHAINDAPLVQIERLAADIDKDHRDLVAKLIAPDLTPPPLPKREDAISYAKWRDDAQRYLATYHYGSPKMLGSPIQTVLKAHAELSKSAGPFSVPMAELIPNLPAYLERLILAFHAEDVVEHDLYRELRAVLDRNARDEKSAHVPPTKNKRPPAELPGIYLKGTPLLALFKETVPFGIPITSWKEHGFLLAKSGHGKSQTLRAIVASLLDKDCALFLLDGNGALIKDLERVKSIQHRLVVLDPDDTPALNFFRMSVQPEQQLELYFYLFAAIDQSLTPRMATMVSYLVDLMKVIPGSNLDTLRQVCEAKQFPFPNELARLPAAAQDFFAHHFNTKDQFVSTTKASLAQRIHRLSSYPKFLAMMNAPTNGFDALQAMQEKKIVIVDASRRKLGDDGSAIFGRYILAQCLAAAWQRSDKDHLALIVVDEAKAYLDQHSKKFLSDTRHFNVGLLLATQFADQLDDGVRKEVINNTTVKIAGPMAYSVVAQLNRDMRCEADFILSMKKKDFEYAEWACYVDNLTPQAIRLTVPFGAIEKLPMGPPRPRRAATPPPPPPQPDPPKQNGAEPGDLPRDTEY